MDLNAVFSEGKKEWRRRRSISRDSGTLKTKLTGLSARLTALGQGAWGERIDITAFPVIKSGLETIQAQLDDLQRKSEDCLKRIGDKESEKEQESRRFANEQKSVEERKQAVDSRLNTEKELLKTLQKNLSQAENRSNQIHREREELHKKTTDAAATAGQRSGYDKRLQELAGEEAGLLSARRDQNEAIRVQNEKIEPLQAESRELQKQINDVLNRRKEILGGIDKGLGEIRKEMEGHRIKTKEIEKTQADMFQRLGEGLAAGPDSIPCLNTELGAVREAEREIEEIKSKVADLDSRKSAAASGAFNKMIAILAGGILLIIALIVLVAILF